ncbi:MAG TPA: energy transducer TonB, partial [Bryobacteraceae bacterium]|nr:energy transducer TonB [Bryobacteraceae bacterium]
GVPGGMPGAGALGGIIGGLPAAAPPPPPKTPPPPPKPVGPQRVGGNVQAANLINAVKPVYPPLAKMARQQGTVRFEATISKEGTIEDLKVLPGAPPLLVQAATEAVKQWRYKPTMLNGEPVEVLTTIDVNFSLTN